jgi:hypothetical protein
VNYRSQAVRDRVQATLLCPKCLYRNDRGAPLVIIQPDATADCAHCGHTWRLPDADLANE